MFILNISFLSRAFIYAMHERNGAFVSEELINKIAGAVSSFVMITRIYLNVDNTFPPSTNIGHLRSFREICLTI